MVILISAWPDSEAPPYLNAATDLVLIKQAPRRGRGITTENKAKESVKMIWDGQNFNFPP
jgi:hypothetical protein